MDSRYARQLLLPELGAAGQARLGAARVVVVGCGGLGCAVIGMLARSGVGELRLVDRDLVELGNLHRQILFDEEDAAALRPKAVAAAAAVRRCNSDVRVEGRVVDVSPQNVRRVLAGVDLVIDGSDNLETRYLLNDACLELGLPWIYGGAVGTTGMVMVCGPSPAPCLRCLVPEPPAPGGTPTCDTAGVLGTLPVLVGALQASAALALLAGGPPAERTLTTVDPWHGRHSVTPVAREPSCPACAHGRRDFLDGAEASRLVRLCGRGLLQVDPGRDLGLPLAELHERVSRAGQSRLYDHVVRFTVEGVEVTVFADGRALVRTADPAVARAVYARYIGH